MSGYTHSPLLALPPSPPSPPSPPAVTVLATPRRARIGMNVVSTFPTVERWCPTAFARNSQLVTARDGTDLAFLSSTTDRGRAVVVSEQHPAFWRVSCVNGWVLEDPFKGGRGVFFGFVNVRWILSERRERVGQNKSMTSVWLPDLRIIRCSLTSRPSNYQ